jgi:hypothetical protein
VPRIAGDCDNFTIYQRIKRYSWVLGLLTVAILCCPAFGLDRDWTIAQFFHTSWTVIAGAPGTIDQIAQTADGYLWLGSDERGATKAALLSLTRTLSGELIGRGIRVNAISPGPIATPLYSKLGLSAAHLKATSEALQNQIPAKRFGRPEEIASTPVFLAWDEAAFAVGSELVFHFNRKEIRHRFGPPDVIVIDELAIPAPAAGQILVLVASSGVGPWDALIREGKSVVNSPLPLTLGSDLSGVVEAVGSDVTQFKPGDEIYGVTNAFIGAYSEFALATAGDARLPSSPLP